MELHIDFETYSACELKDEGLDNYAKHPTTHVHCMAWAFGDEPVDYIGPVASKWPERFDRVLAHVASGGTVVAHNAAFEFAIWNNVCVPKYGWPPLKIAQMRCTMAQAYAMSLPGSLEKAAAALGVDQQKDMAGARVMMQLAKPKPDGTFWKPEDDPAKFQKLYDYCRQDVIVEREIDKRMVRLSDEEQRIWILDQIINQRGIYVDLPSIEAAIRLVEAEKARLDAAMLKTTGGVVGRCTEVQLLVKWIREQGVDIKGLAKADVLDALASGADSLPESVRQALGLRREAAKSSTAKLVAMKNRASSDGRVRGAAQYHGAHTGRWAHRGIQPGNMPRTRKGIKPSHVEDIFAHLGDRDYIDMMYGPVMDAMADSLRGMLCAAPGKTYFSVDYSNIEGRVLAWLAGEEWKVQAFRDFDNKVGPDIYRLSYSRSFNTPLDQIDDDARQIGKVQELSMGFGGGKGAFQNMARIYGVKVSDERADEIKVAWREAHPKIVRYWYDHEGAAINAVEMGCVCKAGPAGRQIAYKMNGAFLWCRLPGGRVLCYPYPSVKQIETPWGEMKSALHYWRVNQTTNKWEETSTYGGDLAQSVTQAVARDILADAMPRLEADGFEICFTVHDQVVAEKASGNEAADLRRMEELMRQVPVWAKDLPLAAEGWSGARFRK